MKILHTSDWHLGRTLHGADLHEHHATVLRWMVEEVRSRGVDVVVVAGDVYDRAVPPVAAVRLLGEVLGALAEHATVVLTPGNHDSSDRLGFGRDLLRPGVHLLTDLPGLDHPVTLEDAHGEVLVFGLPYLEPDVVRAALAPPGGPPLARSHEAVTRAALDRVRRRAADHPGARTVVLAHTFVTGGRGSDSERDLAVGGVDSVPAELFAGLDYVALGHLHGCQDLGRLVGSPAWYSGSPLAFSFSERDHRKAALLVDLGAPGEVHVERLPLPVPRRLAQLEGPLAEILARAPAHREDWIKAVVTDPARPPGLQDALRAALPHLLETVYAPAGRGPAATAPVVDRATDPVEVMDDFLRFVTHADPSPAEHAVLEDAYTSVRSRRQEAS